jgi:hypothetical protein
MILDLFRKDLVFENIHGYDDIKDIVKRALDTSSSQSLTISFAQSSAF